MAHMIPDRLPLYGVSKGEQKLFSILQKLPDSYIVYHENNCTGLYPDFTIIAPDLGLMVIEVKGWYPKYILGGDSQKIYVKQDGKEQYQKHPVRQARDYMIALLKLCQKHPEVHSLLNPEGERKNHFIFPFGHFAILSNVTATQLTEHPAGDLTAIFPPEKVVPRDVFLSWEDESVTTEKLVKIVRSFFNPIWKFNPLTEEQIDTLRGIIHPEIRIPIKPTAIAQKSISKPILKAKQYSLKQLDLKQEENARSIGKGHRLIYGVAGSGKTIILISRAKLVSSKYPKAQILLLCYNVVLAAYLRKVLNDCLNVTVKHFDEWSKDNKVTRQGYRDLEGKKDTESDKALGDRLLKALENGAPDSEKYDVVMVDEAQDFPSSWFSCILEAMKDRNDGDLIIVGDGSQGLYPRGQVSWKKIGINAQGRTIYRKFDLDKNYRNSREIIELAALFADSSPDETGDNIGSPLVDPHKSTRHTGIKPVWLAAESRQAECNYVVKIVKDILAGKWFDKSTESIAPEDIGLLYPNCYQTEKPILKNFVANLEKIAPTVWLSNKTVDARAKVCDPGIKVQTIHSAKGLQYKVVIIIWGDKFATHYGRRDEEKDRRLLYVGLTRAEDFLLISSSGDSKFIDQIAESNKVMFASYNSDALTIHEHNPQNKQEELGVLLNNLI